MSGPKYADYVIERQRLLAIKAQLEAEIEKGKCVQIRQEIDRCIEENERYFSMVDTEKLEKNIKEASTILSGDTLIKEAEKLTNEIKLIKIENCEIKGNSDSLNQILNFYKRRLRKAKSLNYQLSSIMQDLNVRYNQCRQENRELKFENTQWDTPVALSNISETVMKVYSDIMEQLAESEDFEKEKLKYDEILHNHSFDDNYKVSQMKMYFDSSLVEKQMKDNDMEKLNLRNEFIALSNLVYGECAEIPENIDILRSKITKLITVAQEKMVGEYVSESVSKVMRNLGYEIVCSEVISTQKMEKQYFDYSANSAITVAASENGAMMLEVVGKKNEDGSNGSAASVREDMVRFCPDYQNVKDGLKQYGISLNDKKLCPPDEKYVRFANIKKSETGDRRIVTSRRKKRMYNE